MEIVVILLSVSILSSPPLRAEETAEEITEKESFASVARSYFDKAVGATKSLFKEEEVEEDTTPAVDPDELAREAALATAKEAIVLAEGGYHFTQSKRCGKLYHEMVTQRHHAEFLTVLDGLFFRGLKSVSESVASD